MLSNYIHHFVWNKIKKKQHCNSVAKSVTKVSPR